VTPEQFREWVRLIVAPLVEEPTAVSVNVGKAGHNTVLFVLAVAPADVGRVVGRAGSVIWSLRTLVAAAGARHRVQVALEIENEAGRR
jgi:uncharacterized protein